MYARQNLFEGLENERESSNTASDSEFSSEEEMKEADEAAVDLVEIETTGVELQRFVGEVIRKVRTMVKMFRKSPLERNSAKAYPSTIEYRAEINSRFKDQMEQSFRDY